MFLIVPEVFTLKKNFLTYYSILFLLSSFRHSFTLPLYYLLHWGSISNCLTNQISISGGFLTTLAAKHPILLGCFFFFLIARFKVLIIFGIGALISGAYWAGIEFNWGGFWSSDIVEISLFYYLCTLGYILHFRPLLFSTLSQKCFWWLILGTLFLILKFLDLTSVHLFVLQQQNFYFLLLIIIGFFFNKFYYWLSFLVFWYVLSTPFIFTGMILLLVSFLKKIPRSHIKLVFFSLWIVLVLSNQFFFLINKFLDYYYLYTIFSQKSEAICFFLNKLYFPIFLLKPSLFFKGNLLVLKLNTFFL